MMRFFPGTTSYAAVLVALSLSAAGCKSGGQGGINGDTTTQATNQVQQTPNDPANANLAPISNASDNTGAPPAAYESAPRAAAGNGDASAQYGYNAAQPDQKAYKGEQPNYQRYSAQQDPYASSYPQGGNSGNYNDYEIPVAYAPEPPPELPEYQQPPCPGDDYVWTPGYWNYNQGQGYYWVPGVWAAAPYVGALWTPGWWGTDKGRFGWHRGYWGRHVGYYGGIDYGHGYTGYGYQGGFWKGDHFAYNRTVTNVNTTVVHNVYQYNVKRTERENRVSYNGGRGIHVQPRPAEVAAMHEQHNPPMNSQMQHMQQARSNQQNFAKVNRGKPSVLAVATPLAADRNVQAPQPVNYEARQQHRPGQPAQIPPPQPGHFVEGVQPQPGGPTVRSLHGDDMPAQQEQGRTAAQSDRMHTSEPGTHAQQFPNQNRAGGAGEERHASPTSGPVRHTRPHDQQSEPQTHGGPATGRTSGDERTGDSHPQTHGGPATGRTSGDERTGDSHPQS